MIRQPSAVIVTDGGVDLPDGLAEQFGLHVVPLMLRFGDQDLRSGVDMTPAEFYSRLRQEAALPTTSQPAVGDFYHTYAEAGQSGLPILSFHLSGNLSGSINSARMARELLPDLDIRIVDTGTLSCAMGMQVMVAADMALQGEPPEAILQAVRAVGQAVDLFYTIDKLDYLRRGGRIGRVAGYVGNLLGIRPIITVDKATGTYTATGRARSFRQAAQQIVETVVQRVGEGNDASIIVVHGDCAADAERLVESLTGRLRCRLVEVVRANPSLGVHVGPDALGVACFPGVLPVSAWISALA